MWWGSYISSMDNIVIWIVMLTVPDFQGSNVIFECLHWDLSCDNYHYKINIIFSNLYVRNFFSFWKFVLSCWNWTRKPCSDQRNDIDWTILGQHISTHVLLILRSIESNQMTSYSNSAGFFFSFHFKIW